MTMYRKILVPLDGGPNSALALGHAVELARDQNALLALLVVCPQANKVAGLGALALPDQMEGCRTLLRDAAVTVPADVGVTTHLIRGDPAATIVSAVRKEGYDLVVMPSSGGGWMRRTLLGSVSDRLAADDTVRVLLVSKTG
jgi:nucleotide-binding universal stress UspA family protein